MFKSVGAAVAAAEPASEAEELVRPNPHGRRMKS
jgi:hypothetical protein